MTPIDKRSAVLECTGISAGYSKDRPCVRDFDLTVRSGEVVSLLGANGAGKTTLLLTLAGLLPSLAGTIGISGASIPSGRARASSKAGLVLVPDDRALFITLTVQENLTLASRRGGTTLREVLGYFPALSGRLEVRAGNLSGGEQQMLAIGRALMQDPKVLLIDELSMGLAPAVVEALLPVLRRVADDKGAAVVLVEQHVRLALTVADTAVVLAHGRDVLRGTAAELASAPEKIERAYLGNTAPAETPLPTNDRTATHDR